MNKIKNCLYKFSDKVKEYKTKIYLAMALAPASSLPVFAENNSNQPTTGTNDTMTNIITNMLGIIYMMAKYIGILLATWGVVQLILAFKNEDADSKSRAMMLLVCSVALISAETIINSLGLMSS